jgi:hypothetical protein
MYENFDCKSFQEVIEIKALEERIWLDENIVLLKKSPKKYYEGVFKEIVAEIKDNKSNLKKFHPSLI